MTQEAEKDYGEVFKKTGIRKDQLERISKGVTYSEMERLLAASLLRVTEEPEKGVKKECLKK